MTTKTKDRRVAPVRHDSSLSALERRLERLEHIVAQMRQDVARLASRDHIERNALVNAGLVAASLIDAPVTLPEMNVLH
jgi:hypothetical protein